MGVARGAYDGCGENPDEKRGAAAAIEEETTVPSIAAMDLVMRQLKDEPDVLELPTPCTGRRVENH